MKLLFIGAALASSMFGYVTQTSWATYGALALVIVFVVFSNNKKNNDILDSFQEKATGKRPV